MSAAKIATGTYPDTRLLLWWEIAPEAEYIARVVGPEIAVSIPASACPSEAADRAENRDFGAACALR